MQFWIRLDLTCPMYINLSLLYVCSAKEETCWLRYDFMYVYQFLKDLPAPAPIKVRWPFLISELRHLLQLSNLRRFLNQDRVCMQFLFFLSLCLSYQSSGLHKPFLSHHFAESSSNKLWIYFLKFVWSIYLAKKK